MLLRAAPRLKLQGLPAQMRQCLAHGSIFGIAQTMSSI